MSPTEGVGNKMSPSSREEPMPWMLVGGPTPNALCGAYDAVP